MTDYEKQAVDFLSKTNTSISVNFLRHGKHFDDDKQSRDIYNITLKRGEREFSLKFVQSIAKSGFKVYMAKNKHNLNNLSALKDLPLCKTRKEAITAVSQAITLNGVAVDDREAPTAYDVLSCLQKYDCGSFENFCSECGFDVDSRKAERIYKAVCEEWANVQRLWTDEEISQLQEVQ
jgi:predicted O-linked N-acetylglucosamine transferase (SPINDLY family)